MKIKGCGVNFNETKSQLIHMVNNAMEQRFNCCSSS